jgi:large subunit ribosomal protein LP2
VFVFCWISRVYFAPATCVFVLQKMRALAAYMLCVLGGNQKPSKADIKKVLDAVSIKVEDDRLDQVIKQLEGKDLDALIASGLTRLGAASTGTKHKRK